MNEWRVRVGLKDGGSVLGIYKGEENNPDSVIVTLLSNKSGFCRLKIDTKQCEGSVCIRINDISVIYVFEA